MKVSKRESRFHLFLKNGTMFIEDVQSVDDFEKFAKKSFDETKEQFEGNYSCKELI